ncbi:MAG: hypothetical protein ABWY71_00010 [Candidatus Saccharimonadales bacterium]
MTELLIRQGGQPVALLGAMREVTAQHVPSPAEQVCTQIDAFVETYPFPGKSPSRREKSISKMLNGTEFWDVIDTHATAHDYEGVAQMLGALDRLEQAADQSWFMWAVEPDRPTTQAALRELYGRHDVTLNALLDRAVGVEPTTAEEEAPLARAVERIVFSDAGQMATWNNPTARFGPAPEYVHRLASRPYFKDICLPATFEHIAGIVDDPLYYYRGNAGVQHYQMETATTCYLTDMEGVDPKLAQSFWYAIKNGVRTVDKEGKPVSFSHGGEVDMQGWERILRTYIDRHNELGRDRVRALQEKFGIVNLQRYSSAQLERMSRIAEGDQELLQQLRENDFTLCVSPAYGDSLDSMTTDVEMLEAPANNGEDEKLVWYSEVDGDESFIRALATPALEFGVEPSELYLTAHGAKEYFTYPSRDGQFAFELCSRHFSGDFADLVFYDLNTVEFRPLLLQVLRPSRTTGIRSIVLAACEQAVRGEDTRRSMVETVASRFEPQDNVVVSGSDASVAAQRIDGVFRLWDAEKQTIARVQSYQRVSSTALRATVGIDVPGIR